MDTVTPLEAFWIGFLLVAITTALFLRQPWVRQDAQRRKDGLNGILKTSLQGKLRLHRLALIAFALYLYLGIQNAILPPRGTPLPPGFYTTFTEFATISAPFIVMAGVALMLLILIYDNRDQVTMDRTDAKEREARLMAIETAARVAFTRADSAEQRANVAERRADVAQARADVAQETADTAHERANTTDSEQVVQDERLDIVEKESHGG